MIRIYYTGRRLDTIPPHVREYCKSVSSSNTIILLDECNALWAGMRGRNYIIIVLKYYTMCFPACEGLIMADLFCHLSLN